MELKRESRSSGDTRKKHHLIKRLKKAAKLGEKLENLCSREAGKVDTRTVLEAQVGTAHQETLCQSIIDDIDPNIRYCAYVLRLGADSASDVEGLVKMTIGKNKGVGLDLLEAEVEAASLTSITWRGHTVPLRNADLAICILKAQDATTNLENASDADVEEATKMEMFDSLLEAYGDAERFAKNAVKEDMEATAKVKSSKSEQFSSDLNFVYNYVAYNYLSRRIQRNLMLVDSLRHKLEQEHSEGARFICGKYQDIVKLYDNVLQDSLALSQEIDAKIWYFKAWRTLYVASAYEILNKDWEAISLLGRAREYNSQARSALSQVTVPDKDDILVVTLKEVEELENIIRSYRCKARATWHLRHSGSDDSDVTKKLGELTIDEKSKSDVKEIIEEVKPNF
ncbi:9823_t:CDS:2 [Racocetra fulgida]|uniref:Signal recognition particle subunit SRP68 n=1 Tax=Racocetra fulgida TaxID=60492 RepID=A0A9N8Z7L1_9GLOM|nr:9823_t:CDS:2 [Racocetra fulgida]